MKTDHVPFVYCIYTHTYIRISIYLWKGPFTCRTQVFVREFTSVKPYV